MNYSVVNYYSQPPPPHAQWRCREMVPDDTVHLIINSPSFGTRGSLILDISISSYSINRFSILFIYFILKVKPRLETSQGAPPPRQTTGNVGSVNPLNSASPRALGGYGKYWPYILQQPIRGFCILSVLSFCFRRGCHLPFTDRSPIYPTVCTRRRHCHAAGPDAHLGLPLVH